MIDLGERFFSKKSKAYIQHIVKFDIDSILMLLFFFRLELSISPIDEIDYCMRQVRHMELIVYQMLNDGKFFVQDTILVFRIICRSAV